MKNRISIFIFLIALVNLTNAQTKTSIDEVNSMSYNDMIGDLEATKEILKQNVAAAKSIGYLDGAALSNEKLSIVYFYLRDLDLGMKHSVEAVKYYESINDFEKIANSYADIGFSIKEIDMKKGLEYFRKALEISRNHDVGLTKSKIYNNYGTVLNRSGNKDSALYYHKKSLEICIQFDDSLGTPYSLNNIVEVLSEMGRFDEALKYLDESDKFRKLENNDLSWADNLAYRGDVYYHMKEYDSAIHYYTVSLDLGKKTKFMNLITYCLEKLSDSYEQKNDASNALKYFKELKFHQDSIISVESNAAIASINEEFESAKKEKIIVEQQLQLEQDRIRFYFWLGVLGFVVIIAIWFIINQRKKRREELIKVQHAKELEKASLEKEFVEEKLRIGRELHDNIGSQLTFMISSVDNLLYIEEKDNSKNRLSKISDFGRSTMKELRSTIWAMKNDGGELEDLILKINELKMAIPNNLDIEVINEVKRNVRFNALQLLNLYRIVQESLQNVVKYADAKTVKILFLDVNGQFNLRIVDDGAGFAVNESKDGNGLNNMQRRCEDCGGSFELISSAMGTEVKCTLSV